jgi:hypothetical protein
MYSQEELKQTHRFVIPDDLPLKFQAISQHKAVKVVVESFLVPSVLL